MIKNKNEQDVISEQEYTNQMVTHSTYPEMDSPGDSESDKGSDFFMGLSYEPNEENIPEVFTDDHGEPILSDSNLNFSNESSRQITQLPENERTLSPEAFELWTDIDKIINPNL